MAAHLAPTAGPLTIAFSREQLCDLARRFMVSTYGELTDAYDKAEWCQVQGLLIEFANRCFQQDGPGALTAPDPVRELMEGGGQT